MDPSTNEIEISICCLSTLYIVSEITLASLNPFSLYLSIKLAKSSLNSSVTYFDLLKIQAIEFNDQIRKSAYSFELINNNKLKIFPIPRRDETLYFDYVVKNERNNPVRNNATNLITNVSNVPYTNIEYSTINAPARQWIFRYTLALAKEMLASIRGKYSSIPIPGADVTTNAGDLRSEASAEKTALIDELKQMLEESSRAKYMERDAQIAQNTQDVMYKVPYPIYVY